MENQTEMTNPPKAETKMTNPPKTDKAKDEKKPKMIKIVAMREFRIGEVKYKDGQVVEDNSRVVKVGDLIEVPAKQARDLVKPIAGAFSFSGERYNTDRDVTRHDLTRARLATANDIAGHKPLTPIDDFEDDFEE